MVQLTHDGRLPRHSVAHIIDVAHRPPDPQALYAASAVPNQPPAPVLTAVGYSLLGDQPGPSGEPSRGRFFAALVVLYPLGLKLAHELGHLPVVRPFTPSTPFTPRPRTKTLVVRLFGRDRARSEPPRLQLARGCGAHSPSGAFHSAGLRHHQRTKVTGRQAGASQAWAGPG